mgnify:CR=1 FL=1
MLYRQWLKVLRGRNGAAGMTSHLNIGEEALTPFLEKVANLESVRIGYTRSIRQAIPPLLTLLFISRGLLAKFMRIIINLQKVE